jgi:hypothetical protein
MTDRKKPGVAFWATVALVAVLAAYPLSFGPACWLRTPRDLKVGSFWYRNVMVAPSAYLPIGWLSQRSHRIRQAFGWYAHFRRGSVAVWTGQDDPAYIFL